MSYVTILVANEITNATKITTNDKFKKDNLSCIVCYDYSQYIKLFFKKFTMVLIHT